MVNNYFSYSVGGMWPVCVPISQGAEETNGLDRFLDMAPPHPPIPIDFDQRWLGCVDDQSGNASQL